MFLVMKVTKAAFVEAVAGGDLALVDAMLFAKPALANEVVTSGSRVILGASVLGLAAYLNRWEVCMRLLDRGASVDYVPSPMLVRRRKIREWYTPLQMAILKMVDVSQPGRDVEEMGVLVVERMVAMSGDINAEGVNGITALHMACSLVHGGFHEKTVDYYMWAIERVFNVLLAYGANTKYCNGRKESVEKMYGGKPSLRRLLRLS
jgi:ankyrin repeat protein